MAGGGVNPGTTLFHSSLLSLPDSNATGLSSLAQLYRGQKYRCDEGQMNLGMPVVTNFNFRVVGVT